MTTAASPSLQLLSFGPPQRRLAGMLHQPPAAAPVSGVVLCKPFGQEAIRSHRLYRVLAERLARAGHAVMRLDAYGTGDAMGDDADADLDGWAGDVLAADRELRAHTNVAHTAWFGLRLGGEVALRAARHAPATLQRIVVADLVIDGPGYLSHLRERHATSLAAAFSIARQPDPLARLRDPAAYRDEAVGFALPPALRSQLGAMSVASFAWPAAPKAIVAIADPNGRDGHDLAAVLRRGDVAAPRVRVLSVEHRSDWTRDSADNTALVPPDLLKALLDALGGPA
ncbi:MAG: alpha/beta hydrolase [Rubrivivax sp.]|nr:alpha/beta hydrolase [Rubrivivax sp.]